MKTFFLLLLACPSLTFASVAWFTGPQEVELSAEVLAADDIIVQAYRLAYSGEEGPWTLDLGLGWNAYNLDYQPVLFGTNETLDENSWQTNLSLTHEWNEAWSSTLNFRAYEGFTEYRSIWISEFYRQFFSPFEGYRAPDPHGASIGVSTLWNYLPGTGKAELSVETGRDVIAPGWSFNSAVGQPESDRDTLNTLGGTLRVEQVINSWLKAEVALSARQTTDRDPRYGINSTWVAAAGPVSFRLSGGYSEEAPAFDALYGSALVEWNFLPQWSANVGYRVYEDSGEIETSGFNAQAPGLSSSEIFSGVRWDRGDLAISGGVGFLDANYEALSEDNQFFGNLYRDREWWTFRLAASFAF